MTTQTDTLNMIPATSNYPASWKFAGELHQPGDAGYIGHIFTTPEKTAYIVKPTEYGRRGQIDAISDRAYVFNQFKAAGSTRFSSTTTVKRYTLA
jgi:hypothetical protein